jgi:hypothetical protein
MHGLLLAVDRLALDDDRAQQHAQGARMGHGTAPIGGGDVLVEKFLQAHALEEMVDEGQGAQPLAAKREFG